MLLQDKMRVNTAELEPAVFLMPKKKMEAADGAIRLYVSASECSEYEKQIESFQDGKCALCERCLMDEIDLNTCKRQLLRAAKSCIKPVGLIYG